MTSPLSLKLISAIRFILIRTQSTNSIHLPTKPRTPAKDVAEFCRQLFVHNLLTILKKNESQRKQRIGKNKLEEESVQCQQTKTMLLDFRHRLLQPWEIVYVCHMRGFTDCNLVKPDETATGFVDLRTICV